MPFPDMDVSVTLTGEEWTALLAKLTSRGLSAKGIRVYDSAARKLQAQLLAASNANPSIRGVNRRDLGNVLENPDATA